MNTEPRMHDDIGHAATPSALRRVVSTAMITCALIGILIGLAIMAIGAIIGIFAFLSGRLFTAAGAIDWTMLTTLGIGIAISLGGWLLLYVGASVHSRL